MPHLRPEAEQNQIRHADGRSSPLSALAFLIMILGVYAATMGSTRYSFRDLRELLAKASPLRSGDVLAGLAAGSERAVPTAAGVGAKLRLAGGGPGAVAHDVGPVGVPARAERGDPRRVAWGIDDAVAEHAQQQRLVGPNLNREAADVAVHDGIVDHVVQAIIENQKGTRSD